MGAYLNMIVIRRDKNGIPEDPCLECKHRYIEDIWEDDTCDKADENPINGKCPYYEKENLKDMDENIMIPVNYKFVKNRLESFTAIKTLSENGLLIDKEENEKLSIILNDLIFCLSTAVNKYEKELASGE